MSGKRKKLVFSLIMLGMLSFFVLIAVAVFERILIYTVNSSPEPVARPGVSAWNMMMVVDHYDPHTGNRNACMKDFRIGGNKEFIYSMTTIDPEKTGFCIRDNGLQYKKRPIALAGDSFVFGDGLEYEDTIAYRMEKNLEAEQVDVMNFGVWGFGSTQSTDAIENYVVKYNPSEIVYFFFPNDITDDIKYREYQESGSKWSYQKYTIMKGSRKNILRYKFSRFAPNLYLFTKLLVKTRGTNLSAVPLPVMYGKAQYELHLGHWQYICMDSDQNIIDAIAGFKENLLRQKAAAEKIGAGYTLVFVPPKEFLFWDMFENAKYNPLKVIDDIKAFCDENGIRYLDLLDTMKEHREEIQYFWVFDGHFTPEGSNAAATEVSHFLYPEQAPQVGEQQ